MSNKVLAFNLGRSATGLQYAAQKLCQRRKDNFYTAAELGRILGMHPEAITRWPCRGWLKGRKSPMRQGLRRVWLFTQINIIKCLRQRPWLVDLKSMPEHYFRSVVRREWERNPWYTCQQAAPMLGVKADTSVRDYCSRGWLSAENSHQHGGRGGGPWLIRLSDIEVFLADDPRPQSKHRAFSEGRRKFLLESGQASRLAVVWLVKCPRCGRQVRITAPAELERATDVRDRFIRLYVDGNCEHGSDCLISLNGDHHLGLGEVREE